MWKVAQEEPEHILLEEACPLTEETAEEALSDVFYAALDNASTSFRNACYCFIEGMHTEKADNGYLEGMFQWNFENGK